MTRLLQHYVTEQATTAPARVAVVDLSESLSYGELDELSSRIARALVEIAGCRPGDRVGILMAKSPTAIAGQLAAYKAECIAVPLDPRGPAPRLSLILQASEPLCLLADASAAGVIREIAADGEIELPSIGWLDGDAAVPDAAFDLTDVRRQRPSPPQCRTRPDEPAHILFTSGSTGVPKGVVITHSNVCHFVEWAAGYFGIGLSDRVSGHAALTFDLSTFDIFGAFARGAQLHLVPDELNLLPHKLAAYIRDRELTQWFSVPGVLHYMAQAGVVDGGDFPSLKRIMWCGAVLPTPSLSHWMACVPHATYTNLYGPTEATIASSYHTVREPPANLAADIPIGRPCAGEELLVLDQDRRPVAPGETGEIHIGGVGLAHGYWRDPRQTRDAFLPDPRNGNAARRIYKTGDLGRFDDEGLLHFVGRADSQIKTRGYRVELGEIEAALHRIDWVRECAVVALPTDDFAGTVIGCAYVPSNGAGANGGQEAGALRRALAELLPGYMIPVRWQRVDRLSTNVNGKIDRRAIARQLEGRRQSHAADD